jgi:arylsulfatase A-like enzyme
VTVQSAVEFIRDAQRRKQPFLAVVWFGNPHGPHVATEELRSLYPDQPANLQNYYGEITGIDRAVGMLRRELRTLNIADNTLVWYTSDNGAQGPGSTGGLSGKKGSLWEGGIRVPAIIEWPARIKSPAVYDTAACSVDIYPTLLEITGAKVERQPPLDGISLLPAIDGQFQQRPRPLGFWVYPRGGKGVRSADLLRPWRRNKRDRRSRWRTTRTPARSPSDSRSTRSPATPPGSTATSSCTASPAKARRNTRCSIWPTTPRKRQTFPKCTPTASPA